MQYNMDFVLCIDASKSMQDKIEQVKKTAMNILEDSLMRTGNMGRYNLQCRVKLILFRDYLADGKNAMLITDFLSFPQQAFQITQLINSITPSGGSFAGRESALEALGYAISSDWSTDGDKRSYHILLWTDAPAQPLGHGFSASNYPSNMARDFSMLTDWWCGDEKTGKMNHGRRLLSLLTPDVEPWNLIADWWDNVVLFPSQAGEGLTEEDYQAIVDTIVYDDI